MITSSLRTLILRINKQYVALPMYFLREIFPLSNSQPIPLTQNPIRGMIQLRGGALPLLDAGIGLLGHR